MIVEVYDESFVVLEPDDCQRLHVVTADQVDLDVVLRRLGIGMGSPAGEAVLDVEQLWLAARAAATDPDWDVRWAAMVAYATTKGWVTLDGQGLIAHVERTSATRR